MVNKAKAAGKFQMA